MRMLARRRVRAAKKSGISCAGCGCTHNTSHTHTHPCKHTKLIHESDDDQSGGSVTAQRAQFYCAAGKGAGGAGVGGPQQGSHHGTRVVAHTGRVQRTHHPASKRPARSCKASRAVQAAHSCSRSSHGASSARCQRPSACGSTTARPPVRVGSGVRRGSAVATRGGWRRAP